MAYVRTVKTASGATAVQIVWSSRKGSRQIEHLGSAHDEAQVEVLKAAATQRLAAGQQTLDLGLGQIGPAGGPLEIVASCSQHLWQALCQAYRVLGFDGVLDGDEVLRGLVAARIIEPTSKVDSLRVLADTGSSHRRTDPQASAPCDRQTRCAPGLIKGLLCARPVGASESVLYDVSTLHFETDAGDGFLSRGFRRSAAWTPRSPSGCSPTRQAFR